MKRSLAVLTALLIAPWTLQAGTIDFESGFGDLWEIGTVTTMDNEVSFRVGNGAPTNHAVVTQVGGPRTAFVPDDQPAGGAGGQFFLSDESNGPRISLDYFIQFIGAPVASLSLDLYDFRGDGGAAVGDTATLSVYSDIWGGNLVGSTSFTIVPGMPNGSVSNLAINLPSNLIRWATLTFSSPDIGTGIDNITFATIPEPASLSAGLIGLFGVLAGRRRR